MLLMAEIDFEHACSRILYNAHANPAFQMVESVYLREHYAYIFAPDFTNIVQEFFFVIHCIRPAIDHVRTIII